MTGPEWKSHPYLPRDVLTFAGAVLARCVRTLDSADRAYRVALTDGRPLSYGVTAAQAKSRALDLIAAAANERSRIKTPKKVERWTNWHPLAAAGVTKRDVLTFWKQQNFDLQLMTVNGSCPDGNCDGCFLKSEAHLASLHRRHPDRAAWWPAMESMLGELVGKPDDARFNKRWSRADLHSFVDRQADWIFNDEAYLCQADAGECFG